MSDVIKFYDGSQCIAQCRSAMVPPIGSKFALRGKVWIVKDVTYALDYPDMEPSGKIMRANVDLKSVVLKSRRS